MGNWNLSAPEVESGRVRNNKQTAEGVLQPFVVFRNGKRMNYLIPGRFARASG
jgi:hypothetical protein